MKKSTSVIVTTAVYILVIFGIFLSCNKNEIKPANETKEQQKTISMPSIGGVTGTAKVVGTIVNGEAVPSFNSNDLAEFILLSGYEEVESISLIYQNEQSHIVILASKEDGTNHGINISLMVDDATGNILLLPPNDPGGSIFMVVHECHGHLCGKCAFNYNFLSGAIDGCLCRDEQGSGTCSHHICNATVFTYADLYAAM